VPCIFPRNPTPTCPPMTCSRKMVPCACMHHGASLMNAPWCFTHACTMVLHSCMHHGASIMHASWCCTHSCTMVSRAY
jgi:hypothetical protein